MVNQSYKNHIRYYAPHHFIFYPILFFALAICVGYIFRDNQNTAIWVAISFLIFSVISLSFMMRQHYSLVAQNRIIMLELRFRYYVLTNKRLELIEPQLSQKQLFALRFASDEELPILLQRTLDEKLTPVQIKRAIQHWLPDHMRV